MNVPPPLKLLWAPLAVKEVLSDKEVKLLTNYRAANRIEKRTQALVLLLLDTGIRIDEALTLRVESINFDSLILKVKGKGNKERLLPFSIELRKVLRRLKVGKGPLFQTRDGLRLSYRNNYRGLACWARAGAVPIRWTGEVIACRPVTIGPPFGLPERGPFARLP